MIIAVLDYFPTYSTPHVYNSFQEIDPLSYNTVIRFFNEHVEEITALDFEDYFEILTTYVNALFEVGAYQKHAAMADVVIESSIMNNLNVFHGVDLYEKTLFQKSASLYHLQEFHKSAYVLTELIKINPNNTTYRDFLIKNKLQVKPGYMVKAQGMSISLYFISILIIAFSSFYLDPFLPAWSAKAETLRNIAFAGGTAILLGTDGVHRFKAYFQTYNLVSKAKEKMKRS